MKTLCLHRESELYEMISEGVITEVYCKLSPYWVIRLFQWHYMPNFHTIIERDINMNEAREIAVEGLNAYSGTLFPKFDVVITRFSPVYTPHRIAFECKGITIGYGRPEWGAPDEKVFIIKLGMKLL